MPAPTDRNSRIAMAKGWTWQTLPDAAFWVGGHHHGFTHWRNPQGKPADCPNFTGTLEGVSGMMRELNEKARKDGQYWWWGQNAYPLVDAPRDAFICVRHGVAKYTLFLVPWFWSPPDRPGDCVGDAWMSVQEAADASTTD